MGFSLPAGTKTVGKIIARTGAKGVPEEIPKSDPVVEGVTPPVTPITDDKSSGGSPPPDVPPEKPVDVTPDPTTAMGDLAKRRERRAELEAEVARKEKEFREFRESRGAQDLKPTKIGKSARWYAPFGWDDRPSWAPQPASEVEERHRYGLQSHQDPSPFAGEADEMEFSRGQMFAGVGLTAERLEEGIANIQRKKEDNNLKLDDLGAKISERERDLSLINELMPRRADGSLANVANVKPLSEEARRLMEDFTEQVPGEEYSQLNFEALGKLHDELKEDIDALSPEHRRAKLRAGQLLMAEDKYGSMYMDMSTDTDNPSS